MEDYRVNLFFDESGTQQNDKCKLMGGVLIPQKIYELDDIQQMNKELKECKFKLHFTDYSISDKNIYLGVLKKICKYQNFLQMLVINYKNPDGEYDKNSVKNMNYRKFPERIFYGLLRHKGLHIKVNADLYVEKATSYEKIELKENIVNILNDQALYRGEQFRVHNCFYKEKNQEIGVEFTDLILGIIRNIMLYDSTKTSKTYLGKIELIKEALKIPKFFEFLSKLRIFEWNNSESLREVMFTQYLNAFMCINLEKEAIYSEDAKLNESSEQEVSDENVGPKGAVVPIITDNNL